MRHHKCPHCKLIFNKDEDLYQQNNNTDLGKWAIIILFISIVVLGIGVLGYYMWHHQNWIDAFYNATAVMSGVGAADTPSSPQAQVFASFYTLGVGLFYVILVTIFIGTVITDNNVFSQ